MFRLFVGVIPWFAVSLVGVCPVRPVPVLSCSFRGNTVYIPGSADYHTHFSSAQGVSFTATLHTSSDKTTKQRHGATVKHRLYGHDTLLPEQHTSNIIFLPNLARSPAGNAGPARPPLCAGNASLWPAIIAYGIVTSLNTRLVAWLVHRRWFTCSRACGTR